MSKRILVFDDDSAMREMFEFVLTDEGWEAFCYAYSSFDLAGVQQLAPDLIILDLHSAQLGRGWSFLQLLKMEETCAKIPVVICTTALNLSLEIEGYLAVRHISVVRKPFDVDALILTIQENLTANFVLPILVVDDNEHISDATVAFLKLEGYLVTTANNGLVALNAVAQVQHALILLDIEMPVMNGLEFLAAYAQEPGPHSPVIIISGMVNLARELLPAFVIDILPKPYEISHLLALVSKYAQPTEHKDKLR